jgi:hypothetical protein
MYLLDYKHPTELFNQRREALMREARDAHLARELREARSKSKLGGSAADRRSSFGK